MPQTTPHRYYVPWSLIRVAARTMTTHELCDAWAEATRNGETHNGGAYLEAISIHACRTTWGDLIEQSMNRKEEDRGRHETHSI